MVSRFKAQRLTPVALLLLFAILIASCRAPVTSDHLEGSVVDPPGEKPSFTLTDTAGNPFDFEAETSGVLTLLYFGYLSCPDICPVHLAQIAEVFDAIPDIARDAKVVFVSVDPGRDTPEEIRDFLDGFDPRFIGLTGTDEELEVAQKAAGVPPAYRKGEGADYTVEHAGWVIAYAPDGLNHSIYPFGTLQRQWDNDLQMLAGMNGEGAG